MSFFSLSPFFFCECIYAYTKSSGRILWNTNGASSFFFTDSQILGLGGEGLYYISIFFQVLRSYYFRSFSLLPLVPFTLVLQLCSDDSRCPLPFLARLVV